jgi:hypothetical protein
MIERQQKKQEQKRAEYSAAILKYNAAEFALVRAQKAYEAISAN